MTDSTRLRPDLRVVVQAAMEICATCAHTAHDHEGPCTVVNRDILSPCPCREFWPFREQREDGLRVMSHELGIAGSWPVVLNRRLPSEFWDALAAGSLHRLEVEIEVEGKGFKPERADGVVIGLREFRKARVVALRVDGEDL